MNSRIALGTAQFGHDYGIANKAGQVKPMVVKDILQRAAAHGLNTLDTAIAYGDSEKILGQAGVDGWDVVTKLPALPNDPANVADWVMTQIEGSRSRLAVDQLYGVLVHRPEQLKGEFGEELIAVLQRLKLRGITKKIGVSIYKPEELDGLVGRVDFDLVQAPLNILDQRLVESGWTEKLANLGVELHVRSIYLQGLLLMPEERRPVKFDHWSSIWREWSRWLGVHNYTPLHACLNYVLGIKEVSKIVVGVDSVKQLAETIAVPRERLPSLPNWPKLIDECLLNPGAWAKL